MEKNYLGKGIDISLEDVEIKKLLEKLKGAKYKDTSIDLSFAIGFEKGCLIQDKESEKNIELVSKVDSDIILAVLEDITPLIMYLKGNKNDIYIKHKIISSVAELNNYCAEVINENGNN